MGELNVLATAGDAYRFLSREIGTILRLTWLPLLLTVAIQNFVTIMVIGDAAQDAGDFAGTFASVEGLFGWIVVTLAGALGIAIVAVALHRVILFGERRPGQFFYLQIGRSEWLFAAVSLGFGLAVLLFFGAALVALMLLPFLPVWLLMILCLLGLALAIYLMVRFSLVFPLIVVEGWCNFDLARQMTRGQFWRLLGLWLLVMLPAMFVFTALYRLVAFGSLVIGPVENYVMDTPMLIKLSLLQFVQSFVLAALAAAVLSYSYKAFSGLAGDEVLTPQN